MSLKYYPITCMLLPIHKSHLYTNHIFNLNCDEFKFNYSFLNKVFDLSLKSLAYHNLFDAFLFLKFHMFIFFLSCMFVFIYSLAPIFVFGLVNWKLIHKIIEWLSMKNARFNRALEKKVFRELPHWCSFGLIIKKLDTSSFLEGKIRGKTNTAKKHDSLWTVLFDLKEAGPFSWPGQNAWTKMQLSLVK